MVCVIIKVPNFLGVVVMNETKMSFFMGQLQKHRDRFNSKHKKQMEEREYQTSQLEQLKSSLAFTEKELNRLSEELPIKKELVKEKQHEFQSFILGANLMEIENGQKVKEMHLEIISLEQEVKDNTSLTGKLSLEKLDLMKKIREFKLPPYILNPYEEIEETLNEIPEVKNEFLEMEKPLIVLQKIYEDKDWHLDIDLDFVMDKSWVQPKIGFKSIGFTSGGEDLNFSAQEVFSHSDDDVCRGHVVDTLYRNVNVLDTNNATTIYEFFEGYIEINDIHFETIHSGEGEQYLKRIFIKNPYANTEEENYIMISPSNMQYVERDRHRDTNPFSLFVSFSKYPTTFVF